MRAPQQYNVGEKPTVILCTLKLLAMEEPGFNSVMFYWVWDRVGVLQKIRLLIGVNTTLLLKYITALLGRLLLWGQN